MNTSSDDGLPADAVCDWPITNCYIDAWQQILLAWGLQPIAALGVTIAQGYEGDQFTFFKFQHEDLESLYGTMVGELTIYRSLEQQFQEQLRHGRVVLAEVDAYHLPDTRATSYRVQHVKTTIGVDRIDIGGQRLSYFHNTGHYDLSGEDYTGILRTSPLSIPGTAALPPYVEFVNRRWPALTGRELTDASANLLRRHWGRRPVQNPIRQYRGHFVHHMDRLLARPHTFHDYAFANFRQLGANFELLGRHLDWLQERGVGNFDVASSAARKLSATAKAMQFRVARSVNRGRSDSCDALFDALEQSHETIFAALQPVCDPVRPFGTQAAGRWSAPSP